MERHHMAAGGHALVFPGQGSQRPGMAAPWRAHPAWARWEEAEDVLRTPVARLGTEADELELRDPVNCQIALFVHQAVLAEAWEMVCPVPPRCAAGHSLGEYNALTAAGALTFADALRLVQERARATAAAAGRSPGGMVACIGQPRADVDRVAAIAGAHVCNDNAPGQVVLAGPADALDVVAQLLEGSPGQVRRLAVGAAYHSPAMEPAAAAFLPALIRAPFRDAAVPVIANVDALPHHVAEEWCRLLARQLVHPVRWRETVLWMERAGIALQVELGASAVLTGLAKRTAPQIRRLFADTPEAVEAAAATMLAGAR